jgi:hypothetical protein
MSHKNGSKVSWTPRGMILTSDLKKPKVVRNLSSAEAEAKFIKDINRTPREHLVFDNSPSELDPSFVPLSHYDRLTSAKPMLISKAALEILKKQLE